MALKVPLCEQIYQTTFVLINDKLAQLQNRNFHKIQKTGAWYSVAIKPHEKIQFHFLTIGHHGNPSLEKFNSENKILLNKSEFELEETNEGINKRVL